MPFLFPLTAALYIVGSYPQWRDGASLLRQDAASAWRWLSSRNRANIPTEGSIRESSDSIWVPTGNPNITSRMQSLFATGSIIVEAYNGYQGSQINEKLGDIARELGIANNLRIMGGDGPYGFAQLVRDFVKLKMLEYSKDGHEHRFFVFHPDTTWRGAFLRLEGDAGPLDPEFLGIGHDLFVLCRWMLCVRMALVENLGDQAKKIRFHLLMPAYEPIVIPRPFEFLEALFPMTIDGVVSRGRELVWLRVPNAPRGMLRDVGNIPPPCEGRANTTSSVVALTTWGISMPSAMFAVAAFNPTTALVGVPLWLAFGGSAMVGPVMAAEATRKHLLHEDPPAILG